MTLIELARLGAQMREAQKTYFYPKTRTRSALYTARDLERKFDRAVLQLIGNIASQPALFNPGVGSEPHSE